MRDTSFDVDVPDTLLHTGESLAKLLVHVWCPHGCETEGGCPGSEGAYSQDGLVLSTDFCNGGSSRGGTCNTGSSSGCGDVAGRGGAGDLEGSE